MPFDKNGQWVEPAKSGSTNYQYGTVGYGQDPVFPVRSGGFEDTFADRQEGERIRRERAEMTAKYGAANAGTRSAAMMADLINHPAALVTTRHDAIDEGRKLEQDSYQQQQQALALMREQAQGGGPSMAALQGHAGQDQATLGLMGALHGGQLASGYAQNAGGLAANQAAQARGQETSRALDAWGQGAQQMRGQSLEGMNQSIRAADAASVLNLSQQQQDLERRAQLEQLRLGGLAQDQAYATTTANYQIGLDKDVMDRQNQQQAAQMAALGNFAARAGGIFGSVMDDNGGGSPAPRRRPTTEDLENPYYNG